MKLLLLNAGSSSLKCTLMDSPSSVVLASSLADWAGSVPIYHYTGPNGEEHKEEVSWNGHADAVRRVIHDLVARPIAGSKRLIRNAAVGHRIVHGGQFTTSVRITSDVRSKISALADLAPLHNPPSLETLAAAEAALPRVPHVAVFDTAFHAAIPPEAATYPIPQAWTQDWGIRRFGFHGLSHSYCSRRAAELLERPLQELSYSALSSRAWLLGSSCCWRSKRRHDDGIYAPRRADDGNALRIDRSKYRAACSRTSWPNSGAS